MTADPPPDHHPGRPARSSGCPGQAAAPEGPVDMSMMYLMHHAFRRDLAAFAAASRCTPVDDRATWQALAERWAALREALHHHHNGEDTGLWPLLLERATTDERATLEAMEAEHAEIDPLLEACAAGFARLADARRRGRPGGARRAADARPGSASAGTCSTRRPRRSRCSSA